MPPPGFCTITSGRTACSSACGALPKRARSDVVGLKRPGMRAPWPHAAPGPAARLRPATCRHSPGEFEPQLSRRRRVALGLLCGPKPMPLTICEYRGHRISLLTSDAGCTALVHKSGAVLGFARATRKEGLRVAFVKALCQLAYPPRRVRLLRCGLALEGLHRHPVVANI